MLESGGLLAWKPFLLDPLAQSTQTRNLPRSHPTVCFLGNLYQLRVPCSQETQGVALTFQLLQAACHLRVLFLRSVLEGGIWPATEPTEQVWPFLGEHLKGSWQDPRIQSWKRSRGGRKRVAETWKTQRFFRASDLRKAPAGRRHLPQVRKGTRTDLQRRPHGNCVIVIGNGTTQL